MSILDKHLLITLENDEKWTYPVRLVYYKYVDYLISHKRGNGQPISDSTKEKIMDTAFKIITDRPNINFIADWSRACLPWDEIQKNGKFIKEDDNNCRHKMWKTADIIIKD